eukprot:SM000121S25977  [mRNA]  locus=s121:13838:14118:+ [translate_table: standard]
MQTHRRLAPEPWLRPKATSCDRSRSRHSSESVTAARLSP